jgi:A/G-specific adenine glycosylase
MKVSTRSEVEGFRSALRDWYVARARPLRIRTTREPWFVLVSEVMAQQTQIARVDDAWVGFMERYPTPRALAEASTAEVLRSWAGLGYNRRALNLQRAAATIEREHGGRVPSSVEALMALPGLGAYTARAVAAIAFGRPVAAVDTNVRRVLNRMSGEELAPAALQAAADALVDQADPATWTHASMELGATTCVSRNPRCGTCPVARWCVSAGQVVAAPRRPAVAVPSFEHTTRWLRGRIIERLRALDDGAWVSLPSAIGEHDAQAIESAVRALQREGLLERRLDGAVRLPSA